MTLPGERTDPGRKPVASPHEGHDFLWLILRLVTTPRDCILFVHLRELFCWHLKHENPETDNEAIDKHLSPHTCLQVLNKLNSSGPCPGQSLLPASALAWHRFCSKVTSGPSCAQTTYPFSHFHECSISPGLPCLRRNRPVLGPYHYCYSPP